MLLNQCKCGNKCEHDSHCWLCDVPIIKRDSKTCYIDKQGTCVNFCPENECQKVAYEYEKLYGLPEIEYQRRLHFYP